MFIQEANSNLWKVQLPSRSNHDPCTPLSSSFSSLYSLIMILLLLLLPHHDPSPLYTTSSCSISSLYSHLPTSHYTPLTIFLLLLILPTSSSFSLYSLIMFHLLLILPHHVPSSPYTPIFLLLLILPHHLSSPLYTPLSSSFSY